MEMVTSEPLVTRYTCPRPEAQHVCLPVISTCWPKDKGAEWWLFNVLLEV